MIFYYHEQKCSASEEMNGNCHWAMLPPVLLAGSWYLGISQQLSYTL
jgi:hypothetical protein